MCFENYVSKMCFCCQTTYVHNVFLNCVSKIFQPVTHRGVARIFQRGGHTVSNTIAMAFSPRNIIGCFLKQSLTKGESRAPQDPPPRYALDTGILGKKEFRLLPIGVEPDLPIASSGALSPKSPGFKPTISFTLLRKSFSSTLKS